MNRPSCAALIASVFLAGCIGRYDVEETRRVARHDEPCAAADAVASEEHADKAELVEVEVIRPAPLCWYRLEQGEGSRRCEGSQSTFDDRREGARAEYVPSASGVEKAYVGSVECTSNGPFLVTQAIADTCAAVPSVTASGGGRDVQGWGDDLYVRELIASDARAPYRACVYEVATKRAPHQCRLGKMLPSLSE